MRRIYTFFLYLLVPLILCRLYLKGRRNQAYRERIAERFALSVKPAPVDIWIHAVSLGEVVAVTPLVEELLTKNHRLLITTMTPAGSGQVQRQFAARVTHQYLPYDLPWCVKRFFNAINPRVGIILETELWPNIIHFGKNKGIKLMSAYARISDKAFQQYLKAKTLFKPILESLTLIGAQSDLDAERYRALGAPSAIVSTLGNMKFDLILPTGVPEELLALKKAFGVTRPVFIAASTHDNEEAQILSHLKRLQKAIPDLILLIAPRRPERFQTVFELCQQQGFKTARRTKPETLSPATDVLILDSLGELLKFYQLSDYAFVGGSLVAVGGHNVLEPIAVNVPVLCGPFMQNSKTICTELKKANALAWCNGIDDLITRLIAMHAEPTVRQMQIENASAVLKRNQGTVLKYLHAVEDLMFLDPANKSRDVGPRNEPTIDGERCGLKLNFNPLDSDAL